MKRTLAIALLALCSCAYVDVSGDGWRVRGVYLLKDPKLDGLRVTTTQASVTDYDSVSKLTGADIAAIATAIVKALTLP